MMGRVSGKVALVSGGARGMGAAFAQRLVEEGAQVVIGDVLDAEGEATASELGANVRFIHLDVTRPEDWDAAVDLATTDFGRLDVLVNNAGIANFGTIDEYTAEQWHQVIGINLTGTFYGIKAAIPALKESGMGSIVNISSTAGLMGMGSFAGYTAAKFGMRGLTKATAIDLGKYNIRSNSVHPGNIRTPMTDGHDIDQSGIPIARLGEPLELANLVLFLASDESSFCTGAEFIADGGQLAGEFPPGNV
ncbi:SDR family oxidoreductase (plasmid) [Arthrobacter sp. Z1-9]